MKAIFETGGKQYYVSVGDTIYVEKLDAEVGSDVTFDKVLFADGKAGNPYVDVTVVCTVEKQAKSERLWQTVENVIIVKQRKSEAILKFLARK